MTYKIRVKMKNRLLKKLLEENRFLLFMWITIKLQKCIEKYEHEARISWWECVP